MFVNLPDQRVLSDVHFEGKAALLSAREFHVQREELRNDRRLMSVPADELAAQEDVAHRAIIAPLNTWSCNVR